MNLLPTITWIKALQEHMVAFQSGDTVPRIYSCVLCSSMNTQFSLPTWRCGLLQCPYSRKAAALFSFCSHFDINDCCVSREWPVLQSLGCMHWSGLWVVALLKLCSGTSSGAVLTQLVLGRVTHQTFGCGRKPAVGWPRIPTELAACPPPVTSSLGYLRSAIWRFS